MKAVLFAVLLLFVVAAAHAEPWEDAVQRALIELDQRSADFAKGGSGTVGAPAPDVGRPLSADPLAARELRAYERSREAGKSAFVLKLPPPAVRNPELKALPLPGRPPDVVEPVPGTREGG